MTTPSREKDLPGWEPSNAAALRHHIPLLLSDQYEEPGLDAVDISEGTDWEHYSEHSTAAFRLHSLTFLNTLTETYRETGEQQYADKAHDLALRWLASRGTPDDSAAWHGHTVALRTGLLAYLVSAGFTPEAEAVAALRLHAEHLSQDEHYQGAWNHGLDQNIALLRASRALGDVELGEIASRRLAAAAAEYVDAQGVVSEQAAHYAVYVHKQLGTAIEELQATGLPVSKELRRRDRIPAFLTWATRPDGFLVQVGDSLLRQPPGDIAADLSYSTGLESSNPPPPARHMVYDDGWAFIRSGWGERRASAAESHLTVRYGTFRRIHGHRDHTSILWFAGGRPVLEDTGFSGYGDKRTRAHELNEVAHSAVHLTGGGPFDWARGTDLLQHAFVPGAAADAELHLLHLAGMPYPDTVRARSIAYFPQLEIMLVRDAITAPQPVRAYQNWQFGASLTLGDGPDSTGAVLHDEAGSVHVRQHLPVDDLGSYRGSEEPFAGWTPTLESMRTPSWCLRFVRKAQQVAFLSSITTRDDLDVRLLAGSRLQVLAGGELLTTLEYDPALGFRPVALDPTGRWDHEPEA